MNNPSSSVLVLGDTDRVCVVAQNMRFEDGVMANAPGYSKISLSGPSPGAPFSLIYQGNIIGNTPTPFLIGTSTDLYSVAQAISVLSPNQYTGTLTKINSSPFSAPAPGFRWTATDFIDKVVFAQNGSTPQYWTPLLSNTAPVPGLPGAASTFDGVSSFFGHLLFWNGYTLTWSDLNDFTNYIPVGLTSNTLSIPDPATTGGVVSFTQPTVGGTHTFTVTDGALYAIGGFYRLTTATGVSYYSVTATAATTVTLTLLNTTGADAPATSFTSVTLLPLVANEAGSAPIVGADSNGPIFNIIQSGDYAYVYKERSIMSMQYVGAGSGVFFVRTEVTNEGLLTRNAVLNCGVGNMYFLGQRELYNYTGGPSPMPVCRQYTRQLYAEIDRSNLSTVVMMHRELRNEIWIIYPISDGTQKVLIWNYIEDSASIDIYDPSILGLTAAKMVTWSDSPAWSSLSGSDTWASNAPTVVWSSLPVSGNSRAAILASGDGNLLIHGLVYDRNGAAYPCFAETMDYDFEDSAMFKYIDLVFISLQVIAPDTAIRNLYVQIGYRSALDAPVNYTPAQKIQVQGSANFTAKVNPGGAGRFIRVRFQSVDADTQWRISAFEISGRAGGTY